MCASESEDSKVYGYYKWPETTAGNYAEILCQYDVQVSKLRTPNPLSGTVFNFIGLVFQSRILKTMK